MIEYTSLMHEADQLAQKEKRSIIFVRSQEHNNMWIDVPKTKKHHLYQCFDLFTSSKEICMTI